MRINIHDFSGHHFPAQLSRELAHRGHEVEHTFCTQYASGHGRLRWSPGDAPTLRFTGLSANTALQKYNVISRLRFEASYAHSWKQFLDDRDVDLVVSCNVPLVSLSFMQSYLRKRRLPWVFWHQDIYSRAMADELARRLPFGAPLIARGLAAAEARQVSNASRVVAIGDPFIEQYRRWGVPTDHASVIPNWAPLDDIAPAPRDNPWSRAQGLPEHGLRLMYSGTLGRKHSPMLLLSLLDAVRARGVDCSLTVCSEGVGADDLRAASAGRSDVRVLGFQPVEQFADVLGSADLMVTLLEPAASQFSVPSKVLSYLAAGRPVVGLMPADNPAALDILATGGFVGAPDESGALAAARWVASASCDSAYLSSAGERARRAALSTFDIQPIADKFATVFSAAGRTSVASAREPVRST